MTGPDRITIRRPVAVLARVTPLLKAEMKVEIRRRLERVDLEIRQLEVQEKRLLGQEADQDRRLEAASSEISRQKEHRRREMRDLLARERQVGDLELGSEIRRGTAEAEAEVAVGDRWDDLLDWEVILEDGTVVAIRAGQARVT